MNFRDQFLSKDPVFVTETAERLAVLAYLMENENSLNESTSVQMFEGANSVLNKLGLKIHKGSGILDYIKSFSTGAGKVILALATGKTEKAKEILKTLKKEDVLDFIYKLDLGTLHIITGPLHMIDAWTGWDLTANIKSKMKKAASFIDEIKQAVIKLKDGVLHAFDGSTQKTLLKHIEVIDKTVS